MNWKDYVSFFFWIVLHLLFRAFYSLLWSIGFAYCLGDMSLLFLYVIFGFWWRSKVGNHTNSYYFYNTDFTLESSSVKSTNELRYNERQILSSFITLNRHINLRLMYCALNNAMFKNSYCYAKIVWPSKEILTFVSVKSSIPLKTFL